MELVALFFLMGFLFGACVGLGVVEYVEKRRLRGVKTKYDVGDKILIEAEITSISINGNKEINYVIKSPYITNHERMPEREIFGRTDSILSLVNVEDKDDKVRSEKYDAVDTDNSEKRMVTPENSSNGGIS